MSDEAKIGSAKGSSSFDWKAFSQQTWVIVLAGVLLPLAGIVLAWLKPGWTTRTKWIATVLMGLVLVGRMRSKSEDAGPDHDDPPSRAAASDQGGRSTAPTRAQQDEAYKKGYRNGRSIAEAMVGNITRSPELAHHWLPDLRKQARMSKEHRAQLPENKEIAGWDDGFMSLAAPYVR